MWSFLRHLPANREGQNAACELIRVFMVEKMGLEPTFLVSFKGELVIVLLLAWEKAKRNTENRPLC